MNTINRTTGDIVQKLWSLCHILRDDGITYNEYVTELTYLLFLKMMQEMTQPKAEPKKRPDLPFVTMMEAFLGKRTPNWKGR